MASYLLCRACNVPILRVSILRAPVLRVSVLKQNPRKQIFRTFVDREPKDPSRTNSSFLRTIKEFLLGPTGELPFNIGKGVVATGALGGIGALAYFGSGMGGEPGAIDRSKLWPEYVKNRIRLTYICCITAITITAIFAGLTFHCNDIMNYVAHNQIPSMVISLMAIIGTGLATQTTEYTTEFGAKHLIWMCHAAVTGCVLAPMCNVGRGIWIMATLYTWCIVGALATIAVTAPSQRFLMTRAPLAMGVSVVLSSAIAGWIFPQSTILGAAFYSTFLYGGLLVFCSFLLYDTQRIILRAETYPLNDPDMPLYDPINAGMEMYMDIFNIFFRVLAMLDIKELAENLSDMIPKGD